MSELNAGYGFDFLRTARARLGAGVGVGFHFLPRDLDVVYGESPVSYSYFLRLSLR